MSGIFGFRSQAMAQVLGSRKSRIIGNSEIGRKRRWSKRRPHFAANRRRLGQRLQSHQKTAQEFPIGALRNIASV